MTLFLPLLTAFLITLITTPLTRNIAFKFGLIDDPNKRPHPAHVHSQIVPRAGGLAIYLGIVTTALIFLPIDQRLIGILTGITILLVMGLIDDKVSYFNPYLRLFLIFLAALIAVLSGIGISFITNPLAPIGFGALFLPAELKNQYIYLNQIVININFFGVRHIFLIADLFAFFLIVALTQVINWSKGVDGQMPGITLVTALTLGFLSLKLAILGDPNQFNLAKLSFIVAGSSLAFLIFNWYPAKIFPGFSGSTILAFMLAVLSILSGAKVATLLLVLAVPMIDFLYIFTKRIASGKSPVWGDRGHLHHRLVDLGFSHRQIALFYMLVSAILGSIALIANTQGKFFGVLVVATIFFGFILWLNSFSK